MVNRIPVHLRLLPRTPAWALDHDSCTTKELRKFFEERTGATLNREQLQKVRDHGSYPLIDRLRQMDRETTFPRFMELAPELRLGVYEALLIVPEETHESEEVPMLHPAILRTSKQVYSEAMPVLYKKNKFRAKVATGFISILRCLFEHSVTMRMLRMLTHLTIDLDLVTPRGKPESAEYSIKAGSLMKGLCLSLSGASRLAELAIKVKPGNQDSSDVDLVEILWPLLLLREDVTVKFEGITAGPEKRLTERESGPEFEAATFGQQIALVKHLFNIELDRPGWEDRSWPFHGIREADMALYALESPGKQLLCLDDIVNMSSVWKDLQREIKSAEASNCEQ